MHKLEWETNGVNWKYSGAVSGKEVINASTLIYGDSRFDDLKFKLIDFLDAESIQINENEIAQIAYQDKAAALSNPYIKMAIVIKDVHLELARLFASFFNDCNWQVEIFNNLIEANSWVGRA